jgi:uracil-DNA glycosylase family 4
LAQCAECSLFNDQAVFVPSAPPSSGDTRLVVVGEAPGVQEAKQGVPFVGPSGRLLEAVLAGAGFDRRDLYLTNACLCRPKDNATPDSKAVKACAPRLEAELQAATSTGAPIVAMGNVAASAIFDIKISILAHRIGPAKESHKYPGVKVIPTVHPAYVLRVSDALPLFVDDIAKIKDDVRVRWEEPRYYAYDDPVAATQALNELRRRGGSVVVDIEVGAEKDESFIHPDRLRLLCVGLAYAPGRAIVIGETALHDGGVRVGLDAVLRGARVVAHNGKFDLTGLGNITEAPLGFDTMLASYVCDERSGTHGLKYLAMERLGAPNYSVLIHKYLTRKGENFAHVPTEVLHKYNAYDVVCTWALMERYEDEMRLGDLTRVHDMLVRASNMFIPIERKGLRVDIGYLEEVGKEFEHQIEALDYQLSEWVANARSPMQVAAALHELGWKVDSTAVGVLQQIKQRSTGAANEFVTLMMEHRKVTKLQGTYVKGILERLVGDVVRPTFLLHGTTTGRLSCRNPNLQNIPRGDTMRRMFIPDEGKVFVQADFKAIELRVIACEAEDQYLRSLFAEDRDIHSEVAARFFGPHFTKEQRVRAKTVVFGLVYGREAAAIGQAFGIPTSEAQSYIDTFFAMIPDVCDWRDRIRDQVLDTEDDLTTSYGRHRRIHLVTDENKVDVVKESLAFVPQSTASDICLNAALELHERHNLDIRLLVHDSILVETDQPDEVARLMEKVMPEVAAETYSDFVPFPVEVKVGMDWSEL